MTECCAWEDFKLSLLNTFARNACPSSLIDWKKARRDWKRYSCTGYEAASMQLRELKSDSEYVLLTQVESGNG